LVYRRRGLMYERFKALYGNDDADDLVWLAPSRTMNPALPQKRCVIGPIVSPSSH
jgi:hypothetical protein